MPQHLRKPVLVNGAVARGSQLRFGTEITGIGGEPWTEAARILGKEFGLEIDTGVIGPGQEYEDPYGGWARLREIGDSGALLVRPDNHVTFRRHDATGDVMAALRDALRQILGRG